MIYLENTTSAQTVWIPKDDGTGSIHSGGTYQDGYDDGYEDGMEYQKGKLSSTAFTENSAYTSTDGWSSVTVNVASGTPILEDKTIVISADTTTVTPSQGYEGFSAVTIDAAEYAQLNYDSGFDDGFVDGYASGSTDEKEKLSATTFTANTAVTVSDGGYSAITVNVPQTGHTDQEMQAEYDLGYSDGVTHQKSLLSTTAITSNGEYTSENGWEEISVQVPQNNPAIEQSKAYTATTNGTSSITPSAIWHIDHSANTYNTYYYFTINGTISSAYYGTTAYRLDYNKAEDYGYVLIKINGQGGLEMDTSNYDQATEPVTFININGIYSFTGSRISASNFNVQALNNVEYYYAMSAVELTVAVEKNISSTAITENGTYMVPSGTDGWSAVSVNVQSAIDYGDLYCLYTENAIFNIASAQGLSTISLNNVSASYLGKWSGWADLGQDRIATWSANTIDSGGTMKFGGGFSWGVPPVTAQSPYFVDSISFPDFHSASIVKMSSTTVRMYLESASINASGATMYNVDSVNILSDGYLKRAKFNDSYCDMIPYVDTDGNACLYWNGTLIYPSYGKCYPVYKKTINGVDKYVVVKNII